MKFEVGDKVRCVNANGTDLVLGKIYEISSMSNEFITVGEKLLSFGIFEFRSDRFSSLCNACQSYKLCIHKKKMNKFYIGQEFIIPDYFTSDMTGIEEQFLSLIRNHKAVVVSITSDHQCEAICNNQRWGYDSKWWHNFDLEVL